MAVLCHTVLKLYDWRPRTFICRACFRLHLGRFFLCLKTYTTEHDKEVRSMDSPHSSMSEEVPIYSQITSDDMMRRQTAALPLTDGASP